MSRAGLLAIEVVRTLFRVFPFPCPTGIVRIGNPTRDSPVLLTCNFRLTVERVRRALRGLDAFLLVANSRGVNVWCAATGGQLSRCRPNERDSTHGVFLHNKQPKQSFDTGFD